MSHMAPPPGKPGSELSRSVLFPILSSPKRLWSKGYLIPAAAVIIPTLYIFYFSNNLTWRIGTIVYLITGLSCVIVYRFCGRPAMWWPMILIFGLQSILMESPLWTVLAPLFGNFEDLIKSPDFFVRFVGLLSVGFREEFFKAIPVLVLAGYTWYHRQSGARSTFPFGVNEPLDAILLCVASAAGFAATESLHDYILPKLQAASSDVEFNKALALGLMGAFSRSFNSITAHIAWSGYFGFFIGMAVLRPRATVALLIAGYLPPAILHAAFDASVIPQPGPAAIPIALLSYALLVAAILKAREVSPTRSQNFATLVLPGAGASPAMPGVPTPKPGMPQPRVQPRVQVEAGRTGAVPLTIKIGSVTWPLKAGVKIEPQHLGVAGVGRGKGPIAEIASNPSDPSLLGLRNISDRAYRARLLNGGIVNVGPGQTVAPLAVGIVIDFGGIEGVIEAK